ncbi:MAG: Flp family type IVb pilin [Alphaproteobacteria bacterium]|nr:Flp family type IVb pilin [Alphaproteobacteria bacterium]
MKFLRRFSADDGGATAIEYGMICSLIVVAILVAVQATATNTVAMYAVITAALN